MRRPARRFPAAALALLACAACAGPGRAYKLGVNGRLAARDWAGATAQIDHGKESEYGEKNSVLYWLDKAAVLHYAGQYRESDEYLDRAEQRLEELYTRSISRAVGTLALNDNTEEFRGDPHERSLLHVLRALNHVLLGRPEEATVEARKVSAFLVELGDALGEAQAYRDDAFAHYLSALLFEDTGHPDDARISLEAARRAYGAWEATYRVPAPAPLVERPALARGEGELVLLHHNGVAPRRETRTFQIAWKEAIAAVHATKESEGDPRVKNALVAGLTGGSVTVAFPAFVQDAYLVKGSEIEAGGRRVATLVAQDISAISRRALEDKIALVRVRAIARATVKFLLARETEEQTKKRAGSGWGAVAGAVARAAAAGTEVADTRCWSTLPAEIRLARLALPAGRHAVQVRYLSASGAVVAVETIEPVQIAPGKRTYVSVRTAQ